MAYITKEQVQEKRKKIAEINKRYGMKATVSGSNSSNITVTVLSGVIDFRRFQDGIVDPDSQFNGYAQTNRYWYHTHYAGQALDYLNEIYGVLLEGHYDNSDAMVDYFDCAWYMYVNIGRWDKDYELITAST